jgi:predicted RNA-binding Zn-ribbon protein involved in translation (DUF1610 family)
MRVSRKVTNDQLLEVVRISRSVTDVLKRLGYKCLTGGTHSYISKRIRKLNANTDHFLTAKEAIRIYQRSGKKSAAEILIYSTTGRRENAYRLRRALIESGVPYACSGCGIGPIWNEQCLVLEVDHKNNDFLDHTIGNLRFLCPNCHSQLRHAMNKGLTTVTEGSWARGGKSAKVL